MSFLRAINSGIKIRLVIEYQCIGNENLFSLPESIDFKVGDVSSNMIIIDSNNMLSIDVATVRRPYSCQWIFLGYHK